MQFGELRVSSKGASSYPRSFFNIEVGQTLKGIDVVAVMERIKELRGVVPKRIVKRVCPTPT
jgi:hypothetical protein